MLDSFKHVVLCDFELHPEGLQEGGKPVPICGVFLDIKTGQKVRLWQDEFGDEPPFPTGKDTLWVAFVASAETGCFLSLGWPVPVNVLDLQVETRLLTNYIDTTLRPPKVSLITALSHFGLDHIDVTEKKDMQELALRGGPWSETEGAALLDYCESDVDALNRLLPCLLPKVSLAHALLRGEFMSATARMEHIGVPTDVESLSLIEKHLDSVKEKLIAETDKQYGVYEGTTFKADRFADYLKERNIPWPRLPSGQLDLKEETFRQAERTHPELTNLRNLISILSETKGKRRLPVGPDNRNRAPLWAFSSRSSRTQPSNQKAIFYKSAWNRYLIKPEPETGLAYLDYAQQEFGIAAALSGDEDMKSVYRSSDPYMEFAKLAGLAPPNATKETHKEARNKCKQCVLAVQYGQEAPGLAARLGCSELEARTLLQMHREAFPAFWAWTQRVQDHAQNYFKLNTVFGWELIVKGFDINPRSLKNFPVQANGAEMMRLACILATERGVRICCPVHDALLIEAPLDLLDEHVAITQECMAEASKIVLDGFEIRTDPKVVRYPDRYVDPDGRGKEMFERVMRLVREAEADNAIDQEPPVGPLATRHLANCVEVPRHP